MWEHARSLRVAPRNAEDPELEITVDINPLVYTLAQGKVL